MISLFLSLLAIGSVGVLFAQPELNGGPVNVPADGIVDGVYIKEHIPTKKLIPYEYVREADVIWSKRAWEYIDLREKINHSLYFPMDEITANGTWIRHAERWSLWTVIRNHVLNGDLQLFSPFSENNLFGEREVRVELLTSSVTAERRRDVLAGLADGSVDIAIGTHALIQESVQFHSLGVVVVDEQHRFGVEQRAALRDKGQDGGAVPDVLVMTATPIPRTAAMTVYGDLDVSVLDQKPPGRTPIVTKHALGEDEEVEVWADVRAEVAAGRQAYIVCPLIEESEKLEVASAEETIARLAFDELKGLRLALLHGRMSSAEKESVMEAFRTGETDVLVATTVIEVGVDVPNATIMVILDADRFGIAQLHQLRGRVGRGVHASRCWLVTSIKENEDGLLSDSNPRIDALVESDDGFYLAEADLELRGEGTLMNKEQKGRSDLKLASLRRDRELVELAREAAYEIVDPDITLSKQSEIRAELSMFLRPEDEEFLFKS